MLPDKSIGRRAVRQWLIGMQQLATQGSQMATS